MFCVGVFNLSRLVFFCFAFSFFFFYFISACYAFCLIAATRRGRRGVRGICLLARCLVEIELFRFVLFRFRFAFVLCFLSGFSSISRFSRVFGSLLSRTLSALAIV